MRKLGTAGLGLAMALTLLAGPALPATAAATGPAAVSKVTAKVLKNQFDEVENPETGKRIKVRGSLVCLKIKANKKWSGNYATTVYKGSSVKTRKYIGTIILSKKYNDDPCFGSGRTKTDAAKLRKAGMYGLEPKTTYTFEVHASGGGSHKDTLKTVKAKTA